MENFSSYMVSLFIDSDSDSVVVTISRRKQHWTAVCILPILSSNWCLYARTHYLRWVGYATEWRRQPVIRDNSLAACPQLFCFLFTLRVSGLQLLPASNAVVSDGTLIEFLFAFGSPVPIISVFQYVHNLYQSNRILFLCRRLILHSKKYHVRQKTALFYFCNIFIKPRSILIIFGTRILR